VVAGCLMFGRTVVGAPRHVGVGAWGWMDAGSETVSILWWPYLGTGSVVNSVPRLDTVGLGQ
jgi:hypothetical protein